MSNFFASEIAKLHVRFDAQEKRVDAILLSLRALIMKGPDMDHDALLALANAVSGKADAALSAAEALNASHSVKTVALDDIGSVLSSIEPKLDQIVALAPAPVAAAAAGSAGVSGAALAGVAN